ncbi:MAG TPA: glucose-6-phosphate isomerase [Chitinophagales bacterium]|nr:glucose-6-phosphate isomerase [Chitinophagales bacterium]
MATYPSFYQTRAYEKLKNSFLQLQNGHMRDMFQADANRFDKMHVNFENMLFDYAKNRLTTEVIQQLSELAEELELQNQMLAMFEGEPINKTENRPVLHTALRNFSGNPVIVNGENVMPKINAVLKKMKSFSDGVIDGSIKGYTNHYFTDIVNIGIGGSDLGPVMVTEALKHYKVPHLQVHFVSNVDGTHITEVLNTLNPETTLFLIASKTFTTQETMANAHSAREWFLQTAHDETFIAKHFVALSTAEKEVVQFGIAKENMFEFWDWVGGRYSLWSAIGLSICLAIGYDNFEQLLKGGYAMDQHFLKEPFHQNIPVLMALIGFWYIEFFGWHTQAIIPYDQYLHRFTAYLQQADMESNGKYIDRNGKRVNHATGPIIWGEPGTNGQHAFFQLMHQGTSIIPADFIAPAKSLNKIGNHHQLLLSNFFAQTEAFMKGKTAEEVENELANKGFTTEQIKYHTPFRVFEGNRPTNSIMFDELNPYNLGKLISAYEHKIFVQGVLWNVFSYDQWGVELGKKLASAILPELTSTTTITTHDNSTNGLINWTKSKQ